MKKCLSIILALGMVFGFALNTLAAPSSKNGDLPDIIEPNGGPYIIVTALSEDSVTFKYGWSNKNFFENPPVAIWIGVYDDSIPGYVKVDEFPLEEGKPNYKDEWTVAFKPGDKIKINFFIRWQTAPASNIWEHELHIN